MKKTLILCLGICLYCLNIKAQEPHDLAPTPPMGFMTWNYFGLDINEAAVKSIAHAMVTTGLRDLGYNYIFIDDGWQGGRDNKNRLIPDPIKFPSGMKALVDYVHSLDMKIGIYSDAAQLTCGGYTGSLGFEEQDAKRFAEWGFDYLKYDYCHAPADWQTAIARYERMSKALKNSGKDICFSICEWGDRAPWLWGKKAGGQLWRTTADIRDKWHSGVKIKKASDLHAMGASILDILNLNAKLSNYAAPNAWNDPDMLIVGLYGKADAPSSELGGNGCTDTEYQTQMSLWCMMAAPLMISCDIRKMNANTRHILTNKDIIAIDQDPLGKQAQRVQNDSIWQLFVKPLSNGDIAIAALNVSDKTQHINLNVETWGITNKTIAKDLWSKEILKIKDQIITEIKAHETKVYRLSN